MNDWEFPKKTGLQGKEGQCQERSVACAKAGRETICGHLAHFRKFNRNFKGYELYTKDDRIQTGECDYVISLLEL